MLASVSDAATVENECQARQLPQKEVRGPPSRHGRPSYDGGATSRDFPTLPMLPPPCFPKGRGGTPDDSSPPVVSFLLEARCRFQCHEASVQRFGEEGRRATHHRRSSPFFQRPAAVSNVNGASVQRFDEEGCQTIRHRWPFPFCRRPAAAPTSTASPSKDSTKKDAGRFVVAGRPLSFGGPLPLPTSTAPPSDA